MDEEIKTGTGKIDREVAKNEFKRFADSRRLERKLARMDENDSRDFHGFSETIIDAIEDGQLVIENDGLPVFTTADGTVLRWTRPRGDAYTAMDRKKQSATVGKMYASMAAITHVPDVTFAKMDTMDLDVCMALYSVFLA